VKIIDAKLQVVEVPLPHPFPSTWNPGNPETKLFVTIAEIITDDGIHGYGAACDSSQLLAGIWDTHIRPLVIGKEITQVEAINTGLVNASLYAYRPWCVEVAVWDALGKYANLPIYKMLGGVQDKVLAYASTGSLKSVEERVEDAERYIAEGFKMMKLRAHHDDPFEDVRIIAEIKKRVGDKLKIAVDANQGWFFTGKRSVAKWDLKKALNVCRAFEEIGIEWIEEPLYGYDFEGLAELRKRTTLHVAGGELNAQVHEYRDLIKHNCFDIYQMDVVLSGGFVQNRKVAAMAEAENKIYTPHTWTHGMGMAAALREAGCTVTADSGGIRALCRERLRAVGPVQTAPYPGFPTDAQAVLMAALLRSRGATVFEENIFENRYRHVDELIRMGASIRVSGRVAVVTGVERLHSAPVRCTDLRGGAALCVAALAAEGETRVSQICHIDRGYEDLARDLRALGADAVRVEETENG